VINPLISNFEEIYEGNLHGLFLKGTSPKIMLFCHGNKGNVYTRQEKVININKLGFSVLIFDYNGFGRSKGVPNETLCYNSGDIFMSYINRCGYTNNNIVLYGEGIGASVATYLAIKYGLNELIIESGLPSIKKLLGYYSPLLKVFSIIFDEFNTEKFLTRYNGKLLVFHSIHDTFVPYSTITEIKNKATKMIDTIGSHDNIVIDWNEIKLFIS
jgi:hypothetical protein